MFHKLRKKNGIESFQKSNALSFNPLSIYSFLMELLFLILNKDKYIFTLLMDFFHLFFGGTMNQILRPMHNFQFVFHSCWGVFFLSLERACLRVMAYSAVLISWTSLPPPLAFSLLVRKKTLEDKELEAFPFPLHCFSLGVCGCLGQGYNIGDVSCYWIPWSSVFPTASLFSFWVHSRFQPTQKMWPHNSHCCYAFLHRFSLLALVLFGIFCMFSRILWYWITSYKDTQTGLMKSWTVNS